ncbi:MAG: sodium:calcium antiporter, partial [Luteimonas sp.]
APLLVRWRTLAPLLICLVVATVAVMVLGYDGVLTRPEGFGLLLGFVAVLAFAISRTRRDSPDVQQTLGAFVATSRDLWINLARFAIAAALLYFGARWIVHSAPIIGVALGMEPLLTGLTVVAIGTALPEVAAAVAAARRGQGDIVVGHVIGSSLFNLLVVLGGTAAYRAVPVPASFVQFELPAALAFALMLYPMLRGDLRLTRKEGGILLLGFVAWLLFELLSNR